MKKFTVQTGNGPLDLYIGNPENEHHPVQFQAKWLSDERGISIPPEVMSSLEKLKKLADENGVPFEELCGYALEAAAVQNQVADSAIQQQEQDREKLQELTTEKE
jgi:hypothetical protein